MTAFISFREDTIRIKVLILYRIAAFVDSEVTLEGALEGKPIEGQIEEGEHAPARPAQT